MHIGVITNPNSRKNKGRNNHAHALKSAIGRAGEVYQTTSVDSIKPILRELLRKRARYWVADGGDGALHWMFRHGLEVLEEEEFAGTGASLPVTLPTRGGTIDFVANNVGIKGRAVELLKTLRQSIENGQAIQEVEVDSMAIDAVEVTADGEEHFRTYGFATAAAGIGQRLAAKYYDDEDPGPRSLFKACILGTMSVPFSISPFPIPGTRALREYGQEIFRPHKARIMLDGMELPFTACTGIHVASMSINLGNVLRFFNKADEPGLMHAIVGEPTPLWMFRNLHRMHLGMEFRGDAIVDRACREMTIEATGDELLEPIIDGEYYRNLRKMTFRLGPRLRIPKVLADRRKNGN